jgi:diaminopimelate epimerase
MRSLSFAKGHGTMNDFVLLVDRTGMTTLSEADVRFLCDRRLGIGGDGVLRAVKARHIPEWEGNPDLWFMDYRNADGSYAEICGNGLRVFVRYLREEDLVPRHEVFVATRAGQRAVWELTDGRLRATLGPVTADPDPTWVSLGGPRWPATPVDVGNPHAVVLLEHAADLGLLDLSRAPSFDGGRFPDGVNVEFVAPVGERHLQMRVFERGVGETYSCGTGTAAAVAAYAMATAGEMVGEYTVDVPGGRLSVEFADGHAYLTGPAVIVARGDVCLPD